MELYNYRSSDSNGSPTWELEETSRVPWHHIAEHRPARSENSELHIEWSRRPGSEPSSVKADVYLWHCPLVDVHTRKEEEEEELDKSGHA